MVLVQIPCGGWLHIELNWHCTRPSPSYILVKLGKSSKRYDYIRNKPLEHRIRYFCTWPSAFISGPNFPVKNIEEKITKKQRFSSLLNCNLLCQKQENDAQIGVPSSPPKYLVVFNWALIRCSLFSRNFRLKHSRCYFWQFFFSVCFCLWMLCYSSFWREELRSHTIEERKY